MSRTEFMPFCHPTMQRYRSEILTCLGLLGVTLALFAHACGNGFVGYDDDDYVVRNPHVQTGPTWEGIRWAFTTMHASNWHPLTWFSLQLDARLYGMRPWGFHLTNMVLHAVNTALLFLVLRFLTGAFWRSVLVALLFGVHPLHVESVAWVAERKDVLSTLFWLLTMAAYAYYAARPGLGRYLLVVVGLAVGLLAKPMLVTLPCVFLLLDYWPLRRLGVKKGSGVFLSDKKTPDPFFGLRAALLEKLPLIAVAALSCTMTVFAQREGKSVMPLEELPLLDRLANAVVAYVRYLEMAVWPDRLAVFYPHPHGNLPAWQVGGAVLLLTAVTLLVLGGARRHPYAPVGWLWYLGTLVPVIGLVQVGEQALADRYTYVPFIGLFLMVVWGANDLLGAWGVRRAVAGVLAGAMLLPLMVATYQQVRVWHDRQTLWEHALAVTEDNYLAHNHVGIMLTEKGQLDAALAHFQESVGIHPRSALAHNNLALVLGQQGHQEEALEHFREAVRLNPRDAMAHYNLGSALLGQGKPTEAVAQLEAAVEVDPAFGDAHNNLGAVLNRLGRNDEARLHFATAVQLNPQNAEAVHNLGGAFENEGALQEAIECYGKAVRLRPGAIVFRCNLAYALHEAGRSEEAAAAYRDALLLAPDWTQMVTRQAWQLATAEDPRLRNAAEAVRLARQACQATEERQPELLDTLAAAYAEAGRFAEAIQTARKALALAAENDQRTLRDEIEQRLRLYEDSRPVRGERAAAPH
jgi:tetratricopeptide (TPR) repeat protein